MSKARAVRTQRIAGETIPLYDPRAHSLEDEIALWRDLVDRSFWHYTLYSFGALAYCRAHPQQDWIEPRIHRPYCDWLQRQGEDWLTGRHTRDEPTKLLSLLPRLSAKSIIGTCSFPTYLHIKDPNLSSQLDSAKIELSTEFLGLIQRVMSGRGSLEWFTSLFGVGEPPRTDGIRSWTAKSCTHMMRTDIEKADPSFRCTSVEVGVTKFHPDTVHADDWVTDEKLESDKDWISKCKNHYGTILPAMQPNGLFSMCCTRYTRDDPAVWVMQREGVREFAKTGQRPRAKDFVLDEREGKWHVFYASGKDGLGRPVFPKVWSAKRMADYAAMFPLRYARDVLLAPEEGGAHPLTETMVDRLWVNIDDVPTNLRYFIHLDTAFKDLARRARGDDSSITLAGHTTDGSGWVYFLEVYGNAEWSDEAYMDEIAKLLARLRDLNRWPSGITDEMSAGKRGAFKSLLRSHLINKYGLLIPSFFEIARGGGPSKDARIATAAGYWATGLARLVRGAPGINKLVAQMLAFPEKVNDKDDYADPAADTWKTPEIYKGARLQTDSQPRQVMRPYDLYLKRVPLREWTAGEAQGVYDENRRREGILARRAGALGHRYGGRPAVWRGG